MWLHGSAQCASRSLRKLLAENRPPIIPLMLSTPDSSVREINPSNRFGLDYAAEAAAMPPPPGRSIIDVHTHIAGRAAAELYQRVAELYGIGLTYSMTQLEQVPIVREVLNDRVRFIAVPNWSGEDKRYEMGEGFIKRIEQFHALGARIAKFWAAPRSVEIGMQIGDPSFMRLDAPMRVEAMQVAHDLGMYFMTHIADPDTWFATRYADASVFGSKRQQYEPFEALLERFPQPWIAAHMGGWPEDLEFLTGLLERHPNLYLDTSATKWMVRELSRHSRDTLLAFLTRFKGRILFGSDIVVMDDHLSPANATMEMAAKANSVEQAFDLYASRYWALRTLFETDYDGESPIADPDLKMIDPDRYSEMDAPQLRGHALPHDVLVSLYHDAAYALLEPLYANR